MRDCLLVRIQGREVIVLLREAKRPSSIRSEKVELRVNRLPEVGSSHLPPMPLSQDAVTVAPSPTACVLPVPIRFLLLTCAQQDGSGV